MRAQDNPATRPFRETCPAGGRLDSGTTYLLQRWDGRWTLPEEFVAGPVTLSFESLPSDALYWLVAKESRRRIFTLDDGHQRFW